MPKLIGTEPNQVPANCMLGSMAYQDKDALRVGQTSIAVDSANAALTVTQTGTGNAFVVEDSTSPDTSPFVISADGNVGVGLTTPIAKAHIISTGASNGTIDSRTSLHLQATDITTAFANTRVQFSYTPSVPKAFIEVGVYGSDYIAFGPTNGTFEAMRLNSSGDLKIGDYVAGGLTSATGIDLMVSAVDNPLVSVVDNGNGSTLIGANSTHGYIGVDGARPLSFKTGCTYNVPDSGTTRMTIDSTSTTITGGVLKLGAASQSTIIATTADGADSSSILICGGGGASTTRGSYIWLLGNEHATYPGRAIIATGAGGVEMNGGPLTLGAGQIKFPATQVPSADANTLDDYEEGAWTPSYAPTAGAFGTVTYDAVTAGKYTKIGRVVVAQFLIRTDAFDIGTGTGSIRIAGLPYAASSSNTGQGLAYSAGFPTNSPSSAFISGSVSFMNLYYKTTANGASLPLWVTDLGTGADANYTAGTLIYETA